jgi:hypothetical protein
MRPRVTASEAGEIADDRFGRGNEHYGFEATRDREQSDVGGDRIADRMDKPDRVTVDRLQDPVQEEIDVIGRDGELTPGREIRGVSAVSAQRNPCGHTGRVAQRRFAARFSRTRTLIRMGLPSNPNASRSRRSRKRR